MRHAETVTFGGSDLDRAAELRAQASALATGPEARFIILWRGKALLRDDSLVLVGAEDKLLGYAREAPIFLGREKSMPIFAADVSSWSPDSADEAAAGGFLDSTVQSHPDAPDGSGFEDLRACMTRLSARDAELAATAKAVLAWHRSHRYCAACGEPSESAMGGWQRNCPACGVRHFPRTDPVVIMLITRGNSVLVGRSPGWPQGMYSLLAGFVEPGETIEAAVRREVFEETAVKVGPVSYLSSQPWPFPMSLMLGCHGEASSSEITVDPVEIEDALWISKEELGDVFAGQHPKILPPRHGAIAGFLLKNWIADTLD